MKVLDHAPVPGPDYWSFRCLRCRYNVDDHGNVLERALEQRRLRRAWKARQKRREKRLRISEG